MSWIEGRLFLHVDSNSVHHIGFRPSTGESLLLESGDRLTLAGLFGDYPPEPKPFMLRMALIPVAEFDRSHYTKLGGLCYEEYVSHIDETDMRMHEGDSRNAWWYAISFGHGREAKLWMDD